MSNLITEAFVQQYRSNVHFLYQQSGSVLRGLVREEPVNAKFHYFERLGETSAVKKTVRHGDTPQVNSQHSRRRAEMVDYEWADLIDKQDKVRILIEPVSSYAINAAWAMGRAYDTEVIAAFIADAIEGETGGTTTTFDSTYQIANGSVGMTVQKLKDAKLLMDKGNVPAADRKLIWSPEASMDLMDDPQVTSSDFNIVQALVMGKLDGPYVGFHFVMTADLLAIASNIRSCYAWHPSAMGVGMGMEFVARIDELPTKSYSTQVYTAGTFGAVRIQDGGGVVEIDIDESV